MIDIFNIPNKSINNQIFTVNSSGSTGWGTWSKPNNISFVYILCIGGGSGGGGGRGNSAAAGSGGGSGGSSAFSTGLFAASLLPDTLFVQVGKGGSGGSGGLSNANGGSGGSGELSYVSVTPSTGTTSVLMMNGAAGPTGGGGGQSSANGTAGAAGTVWVYFTSYIFPQLGQITATAGQIGVVGGTISAGPGNPITLISPISAGASGGGCTAGGTSANGGAITGVGIIPTLVGGTSNSATIIDGSKGLGENLPTNRSSSPLPLFFTGGSGGASSGTSGRVGGRGGNGSYGSGGGGGGAAANSTGGPGGDGGNGIIIITCW